MLVKYTVSEFLSAKGSFSSIDIFSDFISSHEPKAQGKLIVWDSSRRPSVRSHFQT